MRSSAPHLTRARTVVAVSLGVLLTSGLPPAAAAVAAAAPPRAAAPLPAAAPAVAPPPATGVLHIAPGGRGRRDGSSWVHAGDLADLPRFIGARPRGGRIFVRADAGPYRTTGTTYLKAGGVAGAPVVVQGVDVQGRPTVRALLLGTRTAPYRPDGARGREVFELRRGARHLVFANLAFRNQGTPFAVAGDVQGLRIQDVSATNVRYFVNNYASSKEPSAVLTGLVMRNVAVRGFSKSALMLRYTSSNVLLEDVHGDSQQQDRDNFAMGVSLKGGVHHVVLRRVTMMGARDTRGSYWNGDGFAAERGVHDVRFENTRAFGNTDGGYDIKSTRTVLVGAVAADNKRNFRFWSKDARATGCVSVSPLRRGGSGTQAQVWLSKDAAAVLTGCRLTDARTGSVAFELEPGARLVYRGTVTRAPSSRLSKMSSGAKVDLPAAVR